MTPPRPIPLVDPAGRGTPPRLRWLGLEDVALVVLAGLDVAGVLWLLAEVLA